MKPEDLFWQLLGLGDHWYVRSVEYSAAPVNEVRIVIEERSTLFGQLKCAADGAAQSCYDHAKSASGGTLTSSNTCATSSAVCRA